MQVPGTRSPAKIESAEQRRERLAAELRANLMKRKALSRALAADEKAAAVSPAAPPCTGEDPSPR